jgi:hypothetical protein
MNFSLTEEQLLAVIELSFDLGRSGDDLSLDWPLRILRHVKQVLAMEECQSGRMDLFAKETV